MAAGYLGLGAADARHRTCSRCLPASRSRLLIIIGNGFFKPNISSIVGRLYTEGSPLKDAGYNIFYMGINIGAFVCNFVAAILRNRFGWGWAFSAAGIGMIIGVIWFLRGQHSARGRERPRRRRRRRTGSAAASCRSSSSCPSVVAGTVGYMLASWVDLGDFLSADDHGASSSRSSRSSIYYVSLWASAPKNDKGPIARAAGDLRRGRSSSGWSSTRTATR